MFRIDDVPAALALSVVLSLLTVSAAAASGDVVPVGRISQQQVLSIATRWGTSVAANEAKSDCLEAIRRRANHAVVRVFFGAWCDDSRYEVSRFLRLLRTFGKEAPLSVEFFAVDEQKTEPRKQLRMNRVHDLPTFIVLRNGRELGRIVSHPPDTIESDLLRLLDGTASGFLSSDDGAIVRFFAGASPK